MSCYNYLLQVNVFFCLPCSASCHVVASYKLFYCYYYY